eukprot:s554_g12.t1
MEPTAEELNQIETLTGAYDWAGVAEDVRNALDTALGKPTKIRDIIFVARTTWDTITARIQGKGPPNADGTVPARDLTPVDLARLEIFRRVCFRRVGAEPDTPGSLGPAAPAATAATPASITATATSRKLKMSAIVDQTLDAEIQPLTQEEIGKMRLTFQAISLNSQGEWQRKELPGPPDHESWAEIYRVVRTTFLLLETMTAERMDAYSEHIRSLSSRFGKHCWDLVYTADVHMRSEQFERIRRRLQSNPEHGYTEASPWNAVLAQAIREDAFWTREVITPATLRLAQSRSIPAPLSGLDRTGVSLDAEPEREPKKSKKRKAKETDDKSKHDGKCFTHNRRGMEICANWNQGRCGKSPKPQSESRGVAGAPAAASQRRTSGAAAQGCAEARSRSRSPLKRNPKLQRPPEPKVPPGKPVAKRPPLQKATANDDEAPGLTAKAAPATPASAAKATSSSAQSSSQQFFKGTKYGCWTHDPDKLAAKPRCLHLFAGPARQGDVADQLTKLGWAVCSCDTKQPIPTNLLDQATRAAILQDITDQVYDAVFLGTPCETYSAFREVPPGPRPLRSAEEIMGKSTGLNEAEKKQLAEGNQHTEFSAEVMQTAHKSYTPFTMENPEPIYPVSIFNTPSVGEVAKLRNVRAVDFDQCRVGCEAKKPTRLLRYRIEYSGLGGLRCNHEPKTFKDAEGNEYKAPHEKVAARRRTTPDGKSEYASKALGNYHQDFCQVIARAISKVNMERATKMRELQTQGIP